MRFGGHGRLNAVGKNPHCKNEFAWRKTSDIQTAGDGCSNSCWKNAAPHPQNPESEALSPVKAEPKSRKVRMLMSAGRARSEANNFLLRGFQTTPISFWFSKYAWGFYLILFFAAANRSSTTAVVQPGGVAAKNKFPRVVSPITQRSPQPARSAARSGWEDKKKISWHSPNTGRPTARPPRG